jgi:UDP-N-acetylmuramoylalanine--D-glutamate ligase
MRELIHQGQLQGHQGVVVGAGSSGIAAARLLSALGAQVRLLERDARNVTQKIRDLGTDLGWDLRIGAHTTEDFAGANLLILSPGVPLKALAPMIPKACKIVSELELASWFVTEPIIAVTGTTGKTTTTGLISHILEFNGKTVFTGGNIGTPLSEYLLSGKRVDVLVLEVSSFQLQHVRSFHPQVGVFVNFSPNHLDVHTSLEEYFTAKLNLFTRMQENDLAVIHLSLKDELEGRSFTRARRVYYVGTDRFACPALPGPHNQENLEAAWLACRSFGVDEAGVQRAIQTFHPKAHRLEFVGEYAGVRCIDDSKATTITALGAALKSCSAPGAHEKNVMLLAGGVFKGGDVGSLNALMKERVKAVFLFGAGREHFEPVWKDLVPVQWSASLEEAVALACRGAMDGDVVLLSPATSSFDLFSDYKARGKAFQAAVKTYYAGINNDSDPQRN